MGTALGVGGRGGGVGVAEVLLFGEESFSGVDLVRIPEQPSTALPVLPRRKRSPSAGLNQRFSNLNLRQVSRVLGPDPVHILLMLARTEAEFWLDPVPTLHSLSTKIFILLYSNSN